jgi:hypothetical protein
LELKHLYFNLYSQPIQKRWPPEMTYILLSLMVLTNAYLGVVTVDLTEPPHEKRIATIDDLIYGKEFKFAVPDFGTMQGYLALYLEPNKPKMKVTPDMYQFVESTDIRSFMNDSLGLLTRVAK